MRLFKNILRRDLLLNFRNRGELLQPLLFFVIIISLFPLAVTPDQTLLRIIAPGIIWMAALLATLLSFDHIFRQDFEEGVLEQFLLTNDSLIIIILAKIFSHWLMISLPLILITPLLGISLHLSAAMIFNLILSLLLGTPSLCLIGGMASALTVGLKQGGVLLALIVLPLYVPVLIFGVNAILAMLGAFLILSVTLVPFAIAGALRASINNF